MNLIDILGTIFRKRSSPIAAPIEREHLTLCLMPREVIADTKLYKQPRGMVEEGEIEQYFSCFEGFAGPLLDVYQAPFEVARIQGDRKAGRTYTRAESIIQYHIMALNSMTQSGETRAFSTDV